MADTKISGLTALTGANTASGDLLTIVDISDTTMAATGTNKKITLTELQSAPVSAGTANGVLYLNGSKVATSGSALTFDGTNFSISTGSVNISSGRGSNRALTFPDWLIYNSATGNGLVFDNGSEKMRLTSTGLGIGTSSPAQKLEVAGNVNITGAGTSFGNGLNLIQSSVSNNRWGFVPSGGALYLGKTTDAWSSNSVVAVFDSSGNLLVGTTSQITGEKFAADTTGASAKAITARNSAGSGAATIFVWNSATSGDNLFMGFGTEANGAQRGSISYNRTGGLTAYNTTSDYRAKDITGPVENSGALIDSVPVYMGKMKGATQERPMFIAHETPAYAHTGEKDAVDADGNPVYQQMDASALIPVMWAEIQSLRARVAALES